MFSDWMNELTLLLPQCMRHDRAFLEKRLASRPHESAVQSLLTKARQSTALRHRRFEKLPQFHFPSDLPIVTRKSEILAAIKNHQVLVLSGETGSGKTTQIPKFCLEAGFGIEAKIACTQPRRVAALSISRRIAEELQVPWGRQVGCKIRFSDQSNEETYIKVMTDGMLLAEMQADHNLEEYEVIIVDEAHERSLNIDFLLGHLKQLLKRRPDLKLIITSATIETETFSKAFDNAPVIEVSGRLYPVEVRYEPPEEMAEEDLSMIEALAHALENVLIETSHGDILAFLPTERDIRETEDLFRGRYGAEFEILPLFGRLSSSDQERVFKPSNKRKIVLATNVAETSLTIPGIHIVLDTGTARISRYSPKSRTKRLPIEAVSQSSAKQRAGRCGRVSNGLCIRLYSEEEFLKRPVYSQPEIQRANLAEVILRLKAWRLGEIETFPFINPPHPQAIRSGYELLQELGALDHNRELTPLGRDISRLPVDPTLGRMALQSIHEGALEEVLIIASGLSIQDPRERPLQDASAADLAHREFLDPDSDFLTLLNIWNAFEKKSRELKGQSQLRRYCKSRFISFLRMREWKDIYSQLTDALKDAGTSSRSKNDSPLPPRGSITGDSESTPNYAAIHRSILSGLLGHVAHRKEKNLYDATRQRQVATFPGSTLFDRKPGRPQSRANSAPAQDAKEKSHQPEWIMAGEIMETSQVYARTAAGINPEWVVELGSHITTSTYLNPHWHRGQGRVLVTEKISLLGLVLKESKIDFGKVNPTEAKEIFIRSALVEEDLQTHFGFLEHNRDLRNRLEVAQTRMKGPALGNLDDSLLDFYRTRLPDISSVHDLNRVIKERLAENPRYLFAGETDLTQGVEVVWDQHAYPLEARLGNQLARLNYSYAPGEDHDGITIQLNVPTIHNLDENEVLWAIPGFREEQIDCLLKALPKQTRISLMPLAPKVKELATMFEPSSGMEGLRSLIKSRYKVVIPPEEWASDSLPPHLRPRISVRNEDNEEISSGRNIQELRASLSSHQTRNEQAAWSEASLKWEKFDLLDWTWDDLPETLEITRVGDIPVEGFFGLQRSQDQVHLRLFKTRVEALELSPEGFSTLLEKRLQKEIAWIRKDLKKLEQLKAHYLTLGPAEELVETALQCLKNHAFEFDGSLLPLKRANWEKTLASAQERLKFSPTILFSRLENLLALRQSVQVCKKPYPSMNQDLAALLPPKFLLQVPLSRLEHLPRYLKGLLLRAERFSLNPVRDKERQALIAPFLQTLAGLRQEKSPNPDFKREVEEFRWLLEEFKISTFAQELGTVQPVSPKRLLAKIEEIKTLK